MGTREWKPDELCHYGVPGMKWGIRKARKKGVDYAYTSRATKKYARKAARAQKRGNLEKAKKFDTYAKRSQDLDRKIQASVEKTMKGQKLAQRLLRGKYGSTSYHAALVATGDMTVSKKTARVFGEYGAIKVRKLYVRGESSETIRKKLNTSANISRAFDAAIGAARLANTRVTVRRKEDD